MLTLYYTFWMMFIIFILCYFIISSIINFFKLNSLKTLFTIYFKKENKFIIINSFIFTIIFWFLFYILFYNKIYPSLKITENIKIDNSFEVYSNSFNIETKDKLENLNISSNKDIFFQITYFKRNFVILKFNQTMYYKECYNCKLKLLNKKQEYKLMLNDYIYLEPFDNFDNQVYYVIDLYK